MSAHRSSPGFRLALGTCSDTGVRSADELLPIRAPIRSLSCAISIEDLVSVPSSSMLSVSACVPSLPATSAAAPASKLSTACVSGSAVRCA